MPELVAAGLWTTASQLAKFGIYLQDILRGKAEPGCYLQYINDDLYFGHFGCNFGFDSQVNFSVQNGNGCCILINSDTAAPFD